MLSLLNFWENYIDIFMNFVFSSPFSVVPDECSLAVGDSMQIHVEFKALKTGDYENNMIMHYDTGKYDKNKIKLVCCTVYCTQCLINRK